MTLITSSNSKSHLYSLIMVCLTCDRFRIACETTIFADFEYACVNKVEDSVWEAHSRINGRYRKVLHHFRSGDSRRHAVEKRKSEKRYVDFLKTSQYFYKGYIQRLASHFGGMSELRTIAHSLKLSTLSVEEPLRTSPEVQRLINLSLHATLLRLGDLSRYRNDIKTKDRSWEPAVAYYKLAGDIYPSSGNSHNQMAVIALADNNHLDAVYHLYRAIAVAEPHKLAKDNLEIEFRKIINAWDRGEKAAVPLHAQVSEASVRRGAVEALSSWFFRWHAKLYKGEEFNGYDELENEVLSQLAVLLKEQSLEGILEKFVLINIAAEYVAGERVNG